MNHVNHVFVVFPSKIEIQQFALCVMTLYAPVAERMNVNFPGFTCEMSTHCCQHLCKGWSAAYVEGNKKVTRKIRRFGVLRT